MCHRTEEVCVRLFRCRAKGLWRVACEVRVRCSQQTPSGYWAFREYVEEAE